MPTVIRNTLAISFLVILILLLQGTVLRWFLPNWLVPNLMVVLVVFFAFRNPTPGGVVLAFLLGLVLDFSSGQLVGPWAGAFSVVFGLLASISQRIFIQAPLAVGVTAGGASFLSGFIYMVMTHEFKWVSATTFTDFLGEAVLTALTAPLLMRLFEKLVAPRRETASYSRRSRMGRR